MPDKKIVNVRWEDGFKRTYLCTDYKVGKSNYWIQLADGREKWIPVAGVRHVTVSVAD